MGLLSSLLERAAESRPGEVVIETDRPVRVIAQQGGATLGDALPGAAVFEALAEVLSTEQQADLALGEPVKFDLTIAGATWHLVGETASELTSVRARPSEGAYEPADSVPIPIEPDELAPPVDVPRLRPRSPSGPADIDIDIQFDDEAQQEERAGVRLAALRPLAVEAEPRTVWPRQVAGGGGWTRGEPPRGGRRNPTPQQPLRAAPTPREGDVDALAQALPPGCFCFLHVGDRGPGPGEPLVRALGWTALRIGEGDVPEQALAQLVGLPDGAALIVELEDPSPWLPWLLRRAEEGRRVIVETRALTPEGARRILLGVAATDRAEAWLDALPSVHAALVDGRWTLLQA